MMSDLAAADAAGNYELARRIAGRIKALRAQQPTAPKGSAIEPAAPPPAPPSKASLKERTKTSGDGWEDMPAQSVGKVWRVIPRVIGNVWRVEVDGVSYELPADATLGEIDAILSHPSDPWATPPTAQEIAAAKANPSSNLKWAFRPRWASDPIVSEGRDAGFDPDAYLREKNAARPSQDVLAALVIEVPENGAIEFPADLSDSKIIEVIARELGGCKPVAGRIGSGLAALIGGFVVLFGSALAVRWVYRGFVTPPS